MKYAPAIPRRGPPPGGFFHPNGVFTAEMVRREEREAIRRRESCARLISQVVETRQEQAAPQPGQAARILAWLRSE